MPIMPHIDPVEFAAYPEWVRILILMAIFVYALMMLIAAVGFWRKSR
jgi:hypothetical protein